MSYRKQIAVLSGKTGITSLFEYAVSTPRILFYHGVEERLSAERDPIQGNQMDFPTFERQILFLKKKYRFLSMDQFRLMIENNEPLSGRDIVITFDDGYRNNLTTAAPFLHSLDIPYTIFIPVQNILEGRRLPTYYVRATVFNPAVRSLDLGESLGKCYALENDNQRHQANNEIIDVIKRSPGSKVRQIIDEIKHSISQEILEQQDYRYASEELMTLEEIKAIREYGATIGSHCLDHTILHSRQSEKEVVEQLQESKRLIEENIGVCDYFAFPNGNHDSASAFARQKAQEVYKLSFAVNNRAYDINDSKGYVSRIGIPANYWMFKWQLSVAPALNNTFRKNQDGQYV